MKGKFLENNYRLLVRSMNRDVGLYRVLALISALFIPAFRITLPEEALDPMWMRYSFTVYFVFIFVGTYLIPEFRTQIRHIVHISMYILGAWAGYLLYMNGFSDAYMTMFFVVLMFTGISFTSTGSVFAFSLVLVVLSSIAAGMGIAPWQFPFLVLGLLLTSSILVGFRLSILQELNHTQDLMGSIYKGSPDAIFLTNPENFETLDCNLVAREMFAAEGKEILLKHRFSERLRKEVEENQAAEGKSFRTEMEFQRLNGELFWGELSVTYVEIGRDLRLLARISDIDVKKQVEETMRLSDYILQKVDHLVIVANSETDIIYVSPSVSRALGYSNAELSGPAWWLYRAQSGADIDAEKKYLKACASGEVTPSTEPITQLLESRQGEPQWVGWRDAVTDDGLVIRVGTLDNQDHKNELMRRAIFNIAEASSHAKSTFEFYRMIHKEIRAVINTPNFYIAEFDPVADLVSFPYYTDVENDVAQERTGKQRKAGKGLTEYAIALREPFLASKARILELNKLGKVDVSGQAIPESWLGVPMVHDNRVVGLITIQDYYKPEAFSREDLELVSFIANQGAQFVNKMQQDEALRISEVRFRTIYNQAAVGIASIAPHGGFIQVNQRMCDIFGYSEDELLSKEPVDIVHPLDKSVGNVDLALIHKGEIDRYSKEKRYQHKDGSAIYVLLNVSAYREDGEVKFLIAVYEDITEKKLAQEETQLLLTLSTELQQSKTAKDALHMGMVQIAIHGGWDYGEIWWPDLSGEMRYCECHYVSDAKYQAFHMASRDLVSQQEPDYPLAWGVRNTLISWEEDLTKMEGFGRQELATAQGFNTFVLIALREKERPLGVMVLLRQSPLTVNPNQHRLFQAAGSQLISVIQRKLAESAQIESEARYRAISEAAFEGIVIHREGIILEVNTACARIFGHGSEEILAFHLTDLIYEEEPEKWMEKISGDNSEAVEFMGRRKNGSAVHLEAMGQENIWHGAAAHILAIRDITNEKLVEEAREAARIDARFRVYFQNSSEIIQIIDVEGTISYTSPSVQRIAGRNPEDLVGTDYLAQYHEDDHQMIEDVRQELMNHPGETSRSQLRMLHASGERRFVQISLVNLMEDPLVAGILLSSRDITEVIRAQKSMTESEQRFRSLFAHSPDAIFVEREDGIILDVNEAGCALHEMTRDEIVGQHVADLAPEEDREAVMASFKRLFNGEVKYQEGSSVSRNGKVTPVEIRVNVIQYDGSKAIILQARDTTERRKNELVLKESEERFRALVEHATEAIFVLDLETERLIEVNKNAELLFGRDRKELMEMSPRVLNPQYQPDGSLSWERQQELFGAAAEGETVVYEWLHLNASGKEIPCEVRLNRFPSASRTMVRGSVTNITERKLAEKRMLDSREQLRIQNEKLIALAASPAINSGDLEGAFEEISRVACETLGADRSGIWLFDEDGSNFLCKAQFDARTQSTALGQRIPVKDFPRFLQVIQEERVIAATEARTDARVNEFREIYLAPNNIYSVLAAPLRHHGRIAGVVWSEQMDAPKSWVPEVQNFSASMADMVTLSLEAWERKKAEVELAQTFSKMRATFDSTRDGILVVDNDGHILEYNEGFSELSNVPPEILDLDEADTGIGLMMTHIVNPKGLKEAMDRMENNPEIKEGYIYKVKDGRTIEVYVRPMKTNGEIQGRLWFLHDITDLKRVEAALLENETKFRALFAQANDAILVMQGAFISECNDKALEMFGFDREALTGQALHTLSPKVQPDGEVSSEKLMPYLEKAQQNEFVSYTWKHQRADGSPFDAEVSLNLITIGDRELIQAFVRDITERVQAEGALRESERKNKAILGAIPDLMLRISSDGKVLDYKTSDRQDLVQDQDILLDKDLIDVLPKSMADKAAEYMLMALDTGEGQQYESEIEMRGEAKDYETRLVRSGPREVLIIIRDVTERKRTEKELIKRNFELDSFVYRASHDLKAPLNSLMGLIGLVESETGEANVLRYLAMMNKSVVKLDAFIRDLADFSRNARQEIAYTEILWESIVNETLENLNFMEHADRVDKRVSIIGENPFFSDPVRLEIIFNNLISNAVKYQDLQRDNSFVEVTISTSTTQVIIEIRDNGIGIKKDHQPKVFNLFFRASIQSYGSGMGMYIVKNAVDKLEGTIDLESEHGKGTTFTVVIPNKEASVDPLDQQQDKPAVYNKN